MKFRVKSKKLVPKTSRVDVNVKIKGPKSTKSKIEQEFDLKNKKLKYDYKNEKRRINQQRDLTKAQGKGKTTRAVAYSSAAGDVGRAMFDDEQTVQQSAAQKMNGLIEADTNSNFGNADTTETENSTTGEAKKQTGPKTVGGSALWQ